MVGNKDGCDDGDDVDGVADGEDVGSDPDGCMVGGCVTGSIVGEIEGIVEVGEAVGGDVGFVVGTDVGREMVGGSVGVRVGLDVDGPCDGDSVIGDVVGTTDGDAAHTVSDNTLFAKAIVNSVDESLVNTSPAVETASICCWSWVSVAVRETPTMYVAPASTTFDARLDSLSIVVGAASSLKTTTTVFP